MTQKKDLLKIAGITFSISIALSFAISFLLRMLKPSLGLDFTDFHVIMYTQFITHFIAVFLPTMIALIYIRPKLQTLSIQFCGVRNLLLAIPIGLFSIPVISYCNALFLIIIKSIFGKLTFVGLPSPENIPQLILGILLVAVYPALSEELSYRGLILSGLKTRFSLRPAIIFCGVLFAMNHFSLQVFFGIVLIGVLYSYITWRTGSIIPAILMHFINNSASEITGYLSRDSNLPDTKSVILTFSQIIDFALGNPLLFVGYLVVILFILSFSIAVGVVCMHFLKPVRKPEPALEETPEEPPAPADTKRFRMSWFIPGVVIIIILYGFEISKLIS